MTQSIVLTAISFCISLVIIISILVILKPNCVMQYKENQEKTLSYIRVFMMSFTFSLVMATGTLLFNSANIEIASSNAFSADFCTQL